MRPFRLGCVLAAVLTAQGCISSSVLLHVRPDGSGRATIATRLYLSNMRAFDAMFPGEAPRRPPQVEEELPAPTQGQLTMEFGTNVQLVSTRLDNATDGGIRTTEVEFDDIRKVQMQFPPVFANAGQNAVYGISGVAERALMTFAIRPHENGDRLLVVKLPNPRMTNDPNEPITVLADDSPEERLFKQAIKNMSVKMFVEIEPPLLRSNAPRLQGSRATILDLDLDRIINATDESRVRRMMMPGSFQEMLWQIGDLPGAIVPTESEIYLEYEAPPQAAASPPPVAPVPAPPDSEIFLAPLSSANGELRVGAPIDISNNPGYDNQPFFTPDGALLFSSVRGGAAQTDIYRYDLASRLTARVTQTPEAEYSPTVTPDGRRISVVRVEADGSQRLASIVPADGAQTAVSAGQTAPGGPKIQMDAILPNVKPVGYHAWADDHTLALFVLGAARAPATLQLADARTGATRVIATDIGRSVLRMPGTAPQRHISFVQRETTGDAVRLVVKELDPATGTITTLTPAVEGSREADLAWTADGTLLMVKDDVLYAWRRGQAGWKSVTSLQRLSLRGVTRLAVSPRGDWLALVGLAAQSR